MNHPAVADRCRLPLLSAYVAPYCFGDLSVEHRQAFEQHLLECDVCLSEVERLSTSVRILRADESLKQTLNAPELAAVLGLSSRIDQPFAGHLRHALVGSACFALLFAIPMFVETAYVLDQYRATATRLSLAAFGWMFVATIWGLWIDVRKVREGEKGFTAGLGTWLLGAVSLSVVAFQLLPDTATVEATFQTWPANLGYLKSVFYASLVGPVFLLWPFHFVVVMQRELQLGRCHNVLALLSGDALRIPPRGTYYPRLWILTSYFGALAILNYVGVAHLFENLQPHPFRSLFMGLVLARATIWLLLPILCLWWYADSLNELRRECLVVRSFSPAIEPQSPSAH